MIDPVIAADGYTYERNAIMQWIQQSTTYSNRNGTSPVTNAPLANGNLRQNFALRDVIHHFFNTDPRTGIVALSLEEDDLDEDRNFNF